MAGFIRGQAPRYGTKKEGARTDAVAFARVYNHEARVKVGTEYNAPNILLILDNRLMFSLAGLTADELIALRRVIDLAFKLALPVAEHLDAQAEQLYNEGDERAFSRLYRTAPAFAFRERPLRTHYERLPFGPDLVDELVREYSGYDLLAGSRGRRRRISDEAQDVVEADDDAPEDRGDEELG